ncbi:MAG: hypothetical protein ABI383_13370 [Acidobacteriaceae bacterium]
MARVAANQDRAEVLRSHYVYSQHIHVVSGNSHGKLLREETADYTVAPTSRSSSSTLKKLTGRYLKHGKYLFYDKEPVPESGSIDAELVRSFRDDLTGKAAERDDIDNSGHLGVTINLDSEGASKDGIDKDLFPLTSAQQKQYAFRLAGRQVLNKRSVYHIDFRPKDQTDIDWAGEAFIDEQDFQPVFVETKLSKKLPLLVRTMLGTDVPGIGFSVTYARQQDGVWFPSSFGTEFYVRALYFFKRNIAVSLKNSDFEVTHVDAKVTGYSEVKPGDPH